MAELSKREIIEVLQLEKLPPGYFQNVVCRRKNWLGRFCYNMDGPRWNNFVPIPDGNSVSMEIPKELLQLASQIGNETAIYGEEEMIENSRKELGLKEKEPAFEMTYLIPDSISSSDYPTLNYKRTETSKIREDFLKIFEVAFGEEKNGSYQVEENMRKGIEKIIGEKSLGKKQISFVGYSDGEAVSTGTITAKDGKGFLYNAATHIDHRNKGYGAARTAKLIDEAKRRGINEVYIGTEPGTSVENFYKNIGCKEAFRTKAYEIDISKLK